MVYDDRLLESGPRTLLLGLLRPTDRAGQQWMHSHWVASITDSRIILMRRTFSQNCGEYDLKILLLFLEPRSVTTYLRELLFWDGTMCTGTAIQSVAMFCYDSWLKFRGSAWAVAKHSGSQPAMGTFQNMIFKTSRLTGWRSLYKLVVA